MRRLVLLVPIAIVVVFALASAADALRPVGVTHQAAKPAPAPIITANAAPRIELQPPIVRLRERATIAVSGIHTRTLEVLLAGATDAPWSQPARQLPWRSLPSDRRHLARHTAEAGSPRHLPGRASHRREARLRSGRSRCSYGSSRPAPARGRRSTIPSMSSVGGCAASRTGDSWRSRPGPARGSIDATCACTASSSSRTAPPGHPQIRERLGMFVTAVRDGYGARWRLLEATVQALSRVAPTRQAPMSQTTRPTHSWPAHYAYARGAYSTLPNGQSDASQSLTARQRGTSSAAWLARTQESARASSSLSRRG